MSAVLLSVAQVSKHFGGFSALSSLRQPSGAMNARPARGESGRKAARIGHLRGIYDRLSMRIGLSHRGFWET